ncbi:hypothetical protein TrST_g13777 [Triparma strigata]|uniref:Uncharacterized protein n=1 Tax=Triparma strigata TaxID=1606541 RepID=A0A9W7C9P7_9STRA|nr:hypothetical protein TrST_g13777 [Triparma strigata]
MYICLFGVMKGQQTTKAWLLSFMVGDLQDIFIFIPLKIMLLNVYLPQLIGRHVAENNATNQRKHWFARFFNENAIVYVAENHPELEASELAMRAFTFQYENESKLKDGAAPENSSFVLNRAKTKRDLRSNKGSRRQKRQTIWDPIKKGEFGNDVVEDTYKYQGCRKVGMIAFTIFLMLPEGTQMTILDTVIPTLIGSIVYGNVKVYQTKKQAWMLPAMDLAGIGFIIFLGWAYFKRRAWKRAKVEKEEKMIKDAEELQRQQQQQGISSSGLELSVFKQKRQTALLGGSGNTLGGMDMNPIMEQSGMKGFREDSSTGLLTLQPPTKKTPTMRPVLEKTKSASELRKEYDAKIRQKSEAEDVKSTPDVLTGNNTLLNFNSDLKESKKEPTSPPLLDVKKAAEPQAELRNKDEVLRRPSGDESGGHGRSGRMLTQDSKKFDALDMDLD